jgi:acyl-CoA thioesterase FadM
MTAIIADRRLDSATVTQLRPSYEGSNICTWIGFKHVNYVVEEAVLAHFRGAGLAPRALYEQYGAGLDIVALDTRIPHALHMDDLVTAEVVPTGDAGTEFAATVRLSVERDGRPARAATAKVRAVLRRVTGPADPLPDQVAGFAVDRIRRNGTPSLYDPAEALAGAAPNSFAWTTRIPYFYSHFTERLQMSGYLRLMEEVVDRFLADRGVSIKTLLDEQRWIPVVPHSNLSIVDEALMEEEIHTVFTVEDVFKDFTYTARMECYVVRAGEPVLVAHGSITHGYAVISNRRDWALIQFDERLSTALRKGW